MSNVFTQRYETHRTPNGFLFVFYCDLCDYSVTTDEYITESFEEALIEAQNSAKRYFNMCHRCGKWICDEHYNEDDMQCIECSPCHKRRQPLVHTSTAKKCPHCQSKNVNGDCFCHHCGKAI